MSIRSIVRSNFEKTAAEQNVKLAPLTDDLKLLDSGLNSLSIAMIVVRMEESVGFDPFDEPEKIVIPVTYGDFVKLYERAG